MKRRLLFALILALALGRAAAEPGETPVGEYIRLHVVAADDGDAAQALKLEVRDAVLARARTLLSDCPDADTAWQTVRDSLETLEAAATERARDCGWEGRVRAEAGVFDFPDRDYGGLRVPAGEYRALRVVIGDGAGRNWWCVLYPSLCLTGDGEPGEPVAFHSAILDWLRALLGGEGT